MKTWLFLEGYLWLNMDKIEHVVDVFEEKPPKIHLYGPRDCEEEGECWTFQGNDRMDVLRYLKDHSAKQYNQGPAE